MPRAWPPSDPRLTQFWTMHRSDLALALTSLPSFPSLPLCFHLCLGSTSALPTTLRCLIRFFTTSLRLLCPTTLSILSPPTLPPPSLSSLPGLKPTLPTPIHLCLPTLPRQLTFCLATPPFHPLSPLPLAVPDNGRLRTQAMCLLNLWLVAPLTLFKL